MQEIKREFKMEFNMEFNQEFKIVKTHTGIEHGSQNCVKTHTNRKRKDFQKQLSRKYFMHKITQYNLSQSPILNAFLRFGVRRSE
jgi:hypothetical protein